LFAIRCPDDNLLSVEFRSWLYSVGDESAAIFSRTSRNRAVEACCTAEGTATGISSGPPIIRVAWLGVDPILPSSSSRRSRFLRHSFPPILRHLHSHTRIPIQSPVLVVRSLAPPRRTTLLCACVSKLCAPLDPIQTLAAKWRWRRLPSWTRKRRGSGRR
jgi:hypothetical protein